jgi:hypothetical protein
LSGGHYTKAAATASLEYELGHERRGEGSRGEGWEGGCLSLSLRLSGEGTVHKGRAAATALEGGRCTGGGYQCRRAGERVTLPKTGRFTTVQLCCVRTGSVNFSKCDAAPDVLGFPPPISPFPHAPIVCAPPPRPCHLLLCWPHTSHFPGGEGEPGALNPHAVSDVCPSHSLTPPSPTQPIPHPSPTPLPCALLCRW